MQELFVCIQCGRYMNKCVLLHVTVDTWNSLRYHCVLLTAKLDLTIFNAILSVLIHTWHLLPTYFYHHLYRVHEGLCINHLIMSSQQNLYVLIISMHSHMSSCLQYWHNSLACRGNGVLNLKTRDHMVFSTGVNLITYHVKGWLQMSSVMHHLSSRRHCDTDNISYSYCYAAGSVCACYATTE